jgi:two-component sensor histidine kinase
MIKWKSLRNVPSAQRLLQSAWRDGLQLGSPAALCFTLACVTLAAAVRFVTSLFGAGVLLFATFYPATLIVTLVGGVWLGVLAAALGGLLGVMFLSSELIPMQWSAADSTDLILYSGASAVIIWGAEQYRRLVRQLDREGHYRQILVAELSHRLQNKAAIIQSILRHELRHHPDIWNSISGRLRALSATDDLIIQGRAGIDLSAILSKELAPFDLSRTMLQGPAAEVSPKLAVSLALIFHELATNAAKYGALSTPEGRVLVTWSMAHTEVTLRWREIGGPEVAQPVRRGFGGRLIEEGLGPFGGKAVCSFEPPGLDCTITFPAASEICHYVGSSFQSAFCSPYRGQSGSCAPGGRAPHEPTKVLLSKQ